MIPEVYKKPESQGFHHNFPATHKSYNSAVEFSVALANHVMRKTWRSGSDVYGTMLEPEHQVFLMDREATILH